MAHLAMSLTSVLLRASDSPTAWNPFPDAVISAKVKVAMNIKPASSLPPSSSSSSSSSSSLSSSSSSSSSPFRQTTSTNISSSLLMTHLFSFVWLVNNESEVSPSTTSKTASSFFTSSSSSSSSSTSPASSPPSLSASLPLAPLLNQSRQAGSPAYHHQHPPPVSTKAMGFESQKSPLRPVPEEDTLAVINQAMAQYFDPLVIAVGIVGNLLSCLVFLLTPLKARPLSHALSGMGVMDLVYVLACLLVYLASNDQPIYHLPGVCQVTMFATMLSRSLQTWYMLVAHLDRLNAHFQSGFERRKGRVFNTKFALLVMALLATALSVHVLWSFEAMELAGTTYCLPMKDSLQYFLTIRKVHVVVSVIIPLTLIAGVDLILILKFTLYVLCKNDFDEDDDILDHAGGYNSYRHSDDSSFCTDKMVRFPLHEKKSESCEHILANGVARHTHHIGSHHLSTIKEISSDNNSSSLRSFTESLRVGRKDRERKSQLEIISEKLAQADSSNKMSSAKKREVAKYILTLSEDYTAGATDTDTFAQFMSKTKQLIEEQMPMEEVSNSPESNNSPGLSPIASPKRKKQTNRLANSYSHYSQSMSHIRSCDFTSFVSNVSRNTIIPEDHIFPDDAVPCSLMTFFSGLALAALIIPSTYTEARSLFFSSPSPARPSPTAIQQAILFETFVKFSAVYKTVVYFLTLSSFRQAFVWLVTDWIPRKFTSSSKMRTFNREGDIDFV